MPERKRFLLRLDPALYDALERWAGDELRSVNAQIEYLLADAVRQAGRQAGRTPRRQRAGEGERDTEPPEGR